jgi:peptide/nickel transport system substrate-binding protein
MRKLRLASRIAALAVLILGGALGPAAASRITVAIQDLGPETWWPQDISSNKFVTGTIGDPLVRLVSPYQYEPALATAWTISEDGLTYTFKLRDDVLFHDGTKLTAQDVAFTFAPENVANYVGFSQIKGGNLHLVEAKGDDTVVMYLKKPVPILMDYIVRVAIRPASYFKRVGADGYNKHPIGTGPFKFVEHIKSQRVVLAAFDRYYAGKPAFDELIIRVVPEPASRLAMLRTGEADLTYNEIGPNSGEVKKQGFRTASFGPPLQRVLLFNNLLKKERPASVFSDIRVRQALVMAVDRKAVAEAVYFGQAKAGALPIVASTLPFADPRYTPLAYDPAKAKALLAQANLPAGFQPQLYAPTDSKELAVLLVSFWQHIGFNAKLTLLDPGALATAWYQRKLDGDHIILGRLLANGLPSMVYLDPEAQVAAYSNVETAGLVQQAYAIAEPANQEKWFRETFSPKMNELFPIPVMIEQPEGVFAFGKRVKTWEKFDLHAMGFQWLNLAP